MHERYCISISGGCFGGRCTDYCAVTAVEQRTDLTVGRWRFRRAAASTTRLLVQADANTRRSEIEPLGIGGRRHSFAFNVHVLAISGKSMGLA
jgi:formate hydrogenlyase subunit 6/NADH:ubiquinone oxidoreductase subunit I